MNELLACPFCGSPAITEHAEDGSWSVGCGEKDGTIECIGYISLTTFARKADAITAWNRRVPDNSRVIKILEDQAAIFGSDEYARGQPSSSLCERFAVSQCIEAIRAMDIPE